jgi:hypothetical protein
MQVRYCVGDRIIFLRRSDLIDHKFSAWIRLYLETRTLGSSVQNCNQETHEGKQKETEAECNWRTEVWTMKSLSPVTLPAGRGCKAKICVKPGESARSFDRARRLMCGALPQRETQPPSQRGARTHPRRQGDSYGARLVKWRLFFFSLGLCAVKSGSHRAMQLCPWSFF